MFTSFELLGKLQAAVSERVPTCAHSEASDQLVYARSLKTSLLVLPNYKKLPAKTDLNARLTQADS